MELAHHALDAFRAARWFYHDVNFERNRLKCRDVLN